LAFATTNDSTEPFEEFNDSLSYGHPSDLSFKFLRRSGAENAGDLTKPLDITTIGLVTSLGHLYPMRPA
jgi:hypothetical protein